MQIWVTAKQSNMFFQHKKEQLALRKYKLYLEKHDNEIQEFKMNVTSFHFNNSMMRQFCESKRMNKVPKDSPKNFMSE